jgi:hypothetical protein
MGSSPIQPDEREAPKQCNTVVVILVGCGDIVVLPMGASWALLKITNRVIHLRVGQVFDIAVRLVICQYEAPHQHVWSWATIRSTGTSWSRLTAQNSHFTSFPGRKVDFRKVPCEVNLPVPSGHEYDPPECL